MTPHHTARHDTTETRQWKRRHERRNDNNEEEREKEEETERHTDKDRGKRDIAHAAEKATSWEEHRTSDRMAYVDCASG